MKRIFTIAMMLVAFVTAFAAQPRAEYPRPQFERSEWVNLNGEWTYELDLVNTGFDRKLFNSEGFADKIIVPFCPESKLSGVEHKDIITGIWYHRTIQAPAAWTNKKIMLHFGAVYYEAEVYVDGNFVGRHFGGSSPFALDVTKYLADGKAHNLVVRANSDLRAKVQGSGKQSLRSYSYGCVYTRTTGIWQTVWMEATDNYSLDYVQVMTDIDNHQVIVTPRYYRTAASNTLTINIKDGSKVIAKKQVAQIEGLPIVIPVKKYQTWSPENPKLYDVEYIISDKDGKVLDRITSYLGMRKVHTEGNKVYLNNKPYYQRLVLDQGFYPDGIWTAPSDEALRRDIEMSMEVGFNGARLHQKVFEERFLYWADKLGYLVWGEYASWGMDVSSPVSARNYLSEWQDILVRDRNHPSIVTWTPFNEAWYPDNVQYPRFVKDIYDLTHVVDPTRPVNTVSGGAITNEYDICAMHNYEQDPAKLSKSTYNPETGKFRHNKHRFATLVHKHSSGCPTTGDAVSKAEFKQAVYDGERPYFIDEFGGIKCLEANPTKDLAKGATKTSSWGYGKSAVTKEDFYKRLESQVDVLLSLSDKVWGYCYTQLTDVEQEENGIFLYDRTPKYDSKRLKAIFGKNPECKCAPAKK
ncbi:MAG: beta-glucuronidase [Rikenellaceae bacterium]|nr:beta-glucuronidase [Rikenellaceae bacterium]